MSFSPILVRWYQSNKRDLPWRHTQNPYHIWLSEIILQQTRVAQGLPYFERFISQYPTVFDLANASEQEVLNTWQGLGYYSRARNLHATAQFIAQELHGVFPTNYKELLQLKGVGTYTAAAIASFAYNEKVAVVDGNVYRVLARYFGIETDISSSKAKSEFQALANELISDQDPALFNQAIMDFGAMQCTPKNPNCERCPLNESCVALAQQRVKELPIKLKKTKITQRYINYLVFIDPDQKTILHQRSGSGIWKSLYEFESIETPNFATDTQIVDLIEQRYQNQFTIQSITRYNPSPLLHKLSHQHLSINFWRIDVDNYIEFGILTKNINDFPLPIVIYNFFDKYL